MGQAEATQQGKLRLGSKQGRLADPTAWNRFQWYMDLRSGVCASSCSSEAFRGMGRAAAGSVTRGVVCCHTAPLSLEHTLFQKTACASPERIQ